MTVLDMSLGGGVLIAAILVLRRGLLYRLPKWTFLLLWAVALCRLLIPFAVPSPLSVHTGAAWAVQLLEQEEVPVFEPQTPVPPALVTSPGTFREDIPFVPAAPVPAPPLETEPASPLNAVWLAGTALCGLFFAAAYLWALRRFWDAVPAEADFVRRWQEDHPTWLPVQVKVCGAVSAPLAYGLLRPVVLLPRDTDWSDESQLTYVLTHEYVHIRRGDLLWKALLTAALCVHWFNPMVWIMYLRANQDLELACDEAVVRILGLDSRKKYAYALLAAAESGFSSLCITYTTKNHMEERIRAIMKMKKRSTAVILCAALLVVGVSAVFATSPNPAGPKDLEDLPSAVMTGQTAKSDPDPAPTPAEQDVPKNIPERVHPITSTIPDASAAPEQDAEPVQPPVEPIAGPAVEPVADTTEPQQPVQPEPATSTLENRWGVPDGEIPMLAEFVVEDQEDGAELGKYLEATHGLYPEDYTFGRLGSTGIAFVQVHYYETKARKERLIDGAYPVNSKGETYGSGLDSSIVGYDPDLILVRASNGAEGYALSRELEWGNYPGQINTPDDALAYMEWLGTQPNPRLVPVYDVNRDNIVGYFEIYRGDNYGITPDMSLEEAQEVIRKGPQG